jgi:transposase
MMVQSDNTLFFRMKMRQAINGAFSAILLTVNLPAVAPGRPGEALEAWMTEAADSGIAAVARFARGLQVDLPAIKAGLTLAWSNGVTEGQIHRLKLVKRQGYGRAGFALLRQRVLHAA